MTKKRSVPIAIIGMAFRFPGDHDNEEEFWHALLTEQDLVTRIPASRWEVEGLQHPRRAEPGRSVSFAAGVLSQVDQFDAAFFGISPREAAWLDPQQRLLLELSWEALENAGRAPSSIAGSNCAVFVGISGVDYGMRALDDLSGMSAYSMTGNTLSIAANRLSYAFDLRGASLAVDTACSSSLVALHQACNALRSGESATALVGGVNLLLHPYSFVGFTKASMLSAGGRCSTFDAAGDGYVRAEGGAVLLLKPLDAALNDGDAIQAVILATGVNADGGRKTGITIPSVAGQAELMHSVLQRSVLSADDVDYVEAHGTGTAVGDPVEAAAIGQVYGQRRRSGSPLPVGSVKTNLGHMESASGMAGLVKSILILKNRAIPPSLHLVNPNPAIDFAGLNLEPVTQTRSLARKGRKKRVVGVNSFGFGGANAHVLLQEFQPAKKPLRSPQAEAIHAFAPPLFLSARTPQALAALAGRYAALLRRQPAAYYDIAYASARRERHELRLAGLAGNALEMAEQLEQFVADPSVSGMVQASRLPDPGTVAFVYSGNGAQWQGMGRALLKESPRFAAWMQTLDAAIQRQAGFSVIDALQHEGSASRLGDTAVAQPALFAIQVAVTSVLREQGIEANAVMGHSVGEVAAAWAAGIFSLEQAVQVICVRSAAQARTLGSGRMAAVALSREAAQAWIDQLKLGTIEIAAINSPTNTTLSGSPLELKRLHEALKPDGVFFRLLDFDYAFHSRAMDLIQDEITDLLADLRPVAATTARFVSSVEGTQLAGESLGAAYWWRNVRQPVRFAEASVALGELGCRVFIEIGPHAILQRYLGENLAAGGIAGRVLPSLRRDDDGWSRLQELALHTHLLLEPANYDVFFDTPGQAVRLPNYPWQRERHWHPSTSERYGFFDQPRVHPLLGWQLKSAPASWESVLDPETLPWLADHQVGGAVVLPGSAYVELALAAARAHFGGSRHAVDELDILVPVVFDGEHARSLRFELSPRDGSFQIRSRQRLSADEWTLHALGRLPGVPTSVDVAAQPGDADSSGGGTREPALRATTTHCVDHVTHYQLATLLGLDYGPSFQGLARADVSGQTLRAQLAVPVDVARDAAGYQLHPALLDVCFQSLLDFFVDEIEAGQGLPLLPIKFGSVRYFSDTPIAGFRVDLTRRSARSVLADFELFDADGKTVATLGGCRFRAAVLQRKAQSAPACWQNVSELQPLAGESRQIRLPGNAALVASLQAWFVATEPELAREDYFKGTLPLFEALAVAFARDALQALGERQPEHFQAWLNAASQPGTPLQDHFHWLAGLLQAEGLLTQSTAGVWSLNPGDIPPAQVIWQTLLRAYPGNLPELVLFARMGQRLRHVVTENVSSTSIPQTGGASQNDRLLEESAAYRGSRLGISRIVSELASAWPTGRRLRILEISGGAGSLAELLIDSLPAGRFDYVVAHADDENLDKLRAEFGHAPGVLVARLSARTLALEAAGRIPARFDVVILRHSLHQMPDAAVVSAALLGKLAEGGLLLVAERHADLSVDFLGGLAPDWWHKNGDAAPRSRCRSPESWMQTLAAQGYGDIELFREPAADDLQAGSYLVLAKRPLHDDVSTEQTAAATWLLLCHGHAGLLERHVQAALESRGQRVVLAECGSALSQDDAPLSQHDATRAAGQASVSSIVTQAHAQLARLDHVVYLASEPDTGTTKACAADTTRVEALIELVQSCARLPAAPRLSLVTLGGATLDDLPRQATASPLNAALWGFARVVMNEYPAFACRLIDLDFADLDASVAGVLVTELLALSDENEVVLHPEGRFALRMARAAHATTRVSGDDTRFRLDFAVPGQLRNLVWLAQPERVLADDEVDVRVVATGLNFRDVMYLMGLLPDEAVESGFAGASLGLEFSGVVTRVGAGVSELAVGDAVMGFGSACFASHVTTRADALALKPADWTFEAAATVPTVFFTVYYALKQLADLQPGERVLIHGAAGGVGIAAVQLARHLGAEVFATAGSDEKRDFVALLGADHVFDSRSLAFADQIMALTGGEGVDVVLNSLAGEAIRRNLQILKPFGRFLELGKRDFFENTPIGLRPFKNNISYFGIDADQLLVSRPKLAARLFRDVMALFREEALFPLPYRVFQADQIVDAFRTMQQARQIGKVVVKLDAARVPVQRKQPGSVPIRFAADSTWLVTGGISGFGLESARWLAERGVGCLVLVGRRGARTPGATEAVQALEALGARVKVMACDIADESALRTLLEKVRRECPPLTGILHAAMVIDDTLIANLDAARLNKVLAPKLLGAWNLHSLTHAIPLQYFVLYSSVTTFIGNPGQANYVAANAALESLAARRHALGLPATCVGWGPIGDAGYLTRNQAVKDSLTARLGAPPLNARDALNVLDHLLVTPGAIRAVAGFDWSTLARLLPVAAAPRYERLRLHTGQDAVGGSETEDIRTRISGKTADEIRAIVQTLVIGEVSQILCISPERIGLERSLLDLGMDSLMAVELALGLEKRFAVQLPAMLLGEGPSVERVARHLIERLTADTGSGQGESGQGESTQGESGRAGLSPAGLNHLSETQRLDDAVRALAAQHGETLSDADLAETVALTRGQVRSGARD